MIHKEDINLTFPDQPDIIPMDDKSHYLLRGDYSYIWRYNKSTFKITVVNGFYYDGTSVPRLLWSLIDIYPDGIHRPASLIHDYIYKHKGILKNNIQTRFGNSRWEPEERNWNRRDADRLFCRMLRELGVSKVKRRMMYIAVRMFGYFWWVS